MKLVEINFTEDSKQDDEQIEYMRSFPCGSNNKYKSPLNSDGK
jgi:hypothetical protein